MEGRRTMIWGGAVAALALISLGGAAAFNGGVTGLATGGSGGCNGEPQTVPDEVPASVLVASPMEPRVAAAGPTQAVMDSMIVDGKFLIKIDGTRAEWATFEGEEPVLSAQLTADLLELKAVNPTFVFHEADSDLVRDAINGGHQADGDVTLPDLGRIIEVDTDLPQAEFIELLTTVDWVQWAEPVTTLTIATKPANKAEAKLKGQDLSGYQWNMSTLRMPEVHQITDGQGVTVAVLDTGVQAHTDGFRSLRGDLCLDLVDHDAVCDDPNGHGTHVAGVIAQNTDNGFGVIGVAPGVEILPVRVADVEGLAQSHVVAAGILYATRAGADIINVGVGGYNDSRVLEDAVMYAERMGATVVAPVGNDGFTATIMTPARISGVISVGCVDMTATACLYSNHSPQITLMAPGGTLTIDDDGDGVVDGIVQEAVLDGQVGYVVREGTSLSAAHVSGVAALAVALGADKPTLVREALMSHVDPVVQVEGRKLAHVAGLINPYDLLQGIVDNPGGNAADGAECLNHFDCASGVCEGQGCGEDNPGSCAPASRSCTMDLRPYCGCTDTTFYASGSCPMDRFEAEGVCDGPGTGRAN